MENDLDWPEVKHLFINQRKRMLLLLLLLFFFLFPWIQLMVIWKILYICIEELSSLSKKKKKKELKKD